MQDLRTRLVELYPPLRPILGRSLFAMDAQYVSEGTPLGENSNIACIPPVSGGTQRLSVSRWCPSNRGAEWSYRITEFTVFTGLPLRTEIVSLM